jgi:hypothetical protein
MSTGRTKYYDPQQKRLVSIPTRILTALKPKIVRISIGENFTTLKMAPEWFKHDDHDEALKNIVYPKDVTENQQRTFDTVARYRAAVNKPNNNFRQKSLNISENNTETLIIALDDFVQQFGGELSFTNEDVAFDQVADRTASGIANLSSAHLLATDYIPTAKFSFLLDLDYQRDLARSAETMQDFILNFSNAIAEVLTCSNDYVRVTSIEKSGRTRGQSKVKFGVSMPNPEGTQQLVEDLKVLL